MAYTQRVYLNSSDKIDLFAITYDVKRAVADSGVSQGLATVLVPLGDAGVTLLENDPGLHAALRDLLVSLIPEKEGKRPERRSKSGALHAHLRAFFLRQSLTLPIIDGVLAIGHWQEVMVYDFDNRVARRECLIYVMAEGETAAPQKGRGPAAATGQRRGGAPQRTLPPGKAKIV